MAGEWKAILTLDDAATNLVLEEDQELMLGRKDMRPSFAGVVMVAREQCRIRRLPAEIGTGPPQMRLESLGANPTLLLRKTGTKEMLEKGSITDIRHGDKIALMCKAPELAIAVSCTPPPNSADPAADRGGSAEPAATRPNTRKRPSPDSLPEGPNATLEQQAGGCGASSRTPSMGQPLQTATDASDRKWPVVLVMVGIVGSGKTTFAQALVDEYPHLWSRVCQDIIRGGKAGTRQQCLAAVNAAIASGKSAIVDRCNTDVGQRKDFVAAAKANRIAVHAVVLKLPEDVTARRARDRKNHEGGLQGAGAVKISKIMSGKMRKAGGLPSKLEGFSGITTCTNDVEVAKALSSWMAWTSSNAPPAEAGLTAAAALSGADNEGAAQVAGDTQRPGQTSNSLRSPDLGPAIPQPSANAFDIMMGRRQQTTGSASREGLSSIPQALSKQKLIKFHGSWSQHLWQVSQSPSNFRDEHPELQVFSAPDDDGMSGSCVLIFDKYPKARRHLLVLSTNPELESIEDLRREHVPELRHMAMRGRLWAEDQRRQDPELPEFQMGFHAIPSMRQLHLHVISRDFDSPCLKHKKHWNSFTSRFFRDVDSVISELETQGALHIDLQDAKLLLSAGMVCHLCGAACRTVPTLKAHISSCGGT